MSRSLLAAVAAATSGADNAGALAFETPTQMAGGLSAATALELMGVAFPELKGLFGPLSELASRGGSVAAYQDALANADASGFAAFARRHGIAATTSGPADGQLNAAQIFQDRAAAMAGSTTPDARSHGASAIDAGDIFARRAAAANTTHH